MVSLYMKNNLASQFGEILADVRALPTGKKTTKKYQSGDAGTAASAEADPNKTKSQLV